MTVKTETVRCERRTTLRSLPSWVVPTPLPAGFHWCGGVKAWGELGWGEGELQANGPACRSSNGAAR